MQTLADLLNTIPAIDPAATSRANGILIGLLKPVGSPKVGGAYTTGGNAGVEWHTACGQKKAVLVMCRSRRLGRKGSLFPQRSDSHSG